ncbi:unnamed protein product, partial [Clonostachys chloroleuca]
MSLRSSWDPCLTYQNLEAVFVHSKMSISASEAPEFLAQELEMFQIPEFVESSSTPSLPQGVYLHGSRRWVTLRGLPNA